MRQFVISANYRDHSSPNKWLVRRSNEHPDLAVERSTVHAKGVIFCPSTDYEMGFGCSVVAYAEEVMYEGSVPENTISLRFTGRSGNNDFVDGDGKTHKQLAELHLGANGEIMGVPLEAAVAA